MFQIGDRRVLIAYFRIRAKTLPEALIPHRPLPSICRPDDRTHEEAKVFRISSRCAGDHDLVSGLQSGGIDVLRGKLRSAAPFDNPPDGIPFLVLQLLI